MADVFVPAVRHTPVLPVGNDHAEVDVVALVKGSVSRLVPAAPATSGSATVRRAPTNRTGITNRVNLAKVPISPITAFPIPDLALSSVSI